MRRLRIDGLTASEAGETADALDLVMSTCGTYVASTAWMRLVDLAESLRDAERRPWNDSSAPPRPGPSGPSPP